MLFRSAIGAFPILLVPHRTDPHLVNLGVVGDLTEVVLTNIVVVAVVLTVLVESTEHDTSTAENASEQSRSDEVDVLSVNQTGVVDIADERVGSDSVKPTAHHFVDVGVVHSALKVANLDAVVGDDDCRGGVHASIIHPCLGIVNLSAKLS